MFCCNVFPKLIIVRRTHHSSKMLSDLSERPLSIDAEADLVLKSHESSVTFIFGKIVVLFTVLKCIIDLWCHAYWLSEYSFKSYLCVCHVGSVSLPADAVRGNWLLSGLYSLPSQPGLLWFPQQCRWAPLLGGYMVVHRILKHTVKRHGL